jgi:hypothetical protein
VSISKKELELDELEKERPAVRFARKLRTRTIFLLDAVAVPGYLVFIIVQNIKRIGPGRGWLCRRSLSSAAPCCSSCGW